MSLAALSSKLKPEFTAPSEGVWVGTFTGLGQQSFAGGGGFQPQAGGGQFAGGASASQGQGQFFPQQQAQFTAQGPGGAVGPFGQQPPLGKRITWQ